MILRLSTYVETVLDHDPELIKEAFEDLLLGLLKTQEERLQTEVCEAFIEGIDEELQTRRMCGGCGGVCKR
jgi:hypothetical protein